MSKMKMFLGSLFLLSLSVASIASAEFGEPMVNDLAVLDTKPVNDKKCQVKGNTGTDDQGRACVCDDDPDGDPYTVWVCQ